VIELTCMIKLTIKQAKVSKMIYNNINAGKMVKHIKN